MKSRLFSVSTFLFVARSTVLERWRYRAWLDSNQEMAEDWSLPVLCGELGNGVRHLETGLLQQGLQDIRPSKTIFNFFQIGKNTIVLRECPPPSDLIPVKPKIRYRYLPYFRISQKRWSCCGSALLWCGSGCGSWLWFLLFDADPEPTFHPDADPDPDPSLRKGSNPWRSAKIGSYSTRFG